MVIGVGISRPLLLYIPFFFALKFGYSSNSYYSDWAGSVVHKGSSTRTNIKRNDGHFFPSLLSFLREVSQAPRMPWAFSLLFLLGRGTGLSDIFRQVPPPPSS